VLTLLLMSNRLIEAADGAGQIQVGAPVETAVPQAAHPVSESP
jgi:hypothetical protein